ncbi:unnamed protein product [Prorocentrum cordatum]|uniref:Uncharacterized protein n=1 Tax=Prorocentrum cordatum TaxID=2364126 RepID=A0ABN9Y3L1_9DINO|nr:unnamed protein product [Polarella glacialis]
MFWAACTERGAPTASTTSSLGACQACWWTTSSPPRWRARSRSRARASPTCPRRPLGAHRPQAARARRSWWRPSGGRELPFVTHRFLEQRPVAVVGADGDEVLARAVLPRENVGSTGAPEQPLELVVRRKPCAAGPPRWHPAAARELGAPPAADAEATAAARAERAARRCVVPRRLAAGAPQAPGSWEPEGALQAPKFGDFDDVRRHAPELAGAGAQPLDAIKTEPGA